MKTLILGIGNSILRDDGIGPTIIRELEQRCCRPDVFFETTNLAGMPLLDIVTGYDSIIIIDAIQSGSKPGDIQWLHPEDFELARRPCYQHNMGILQMLELGRTLGLDVTEDVRLMAIEACDVTSFREDLTPEVAEAIPEAIEQIMRQIALTDRGDQYSGLQRPVSAVRAVNNEGNQSRIGRL